MTETNIGHGITRDKLKPIISLSLPLIITHSRICSQLFSPFILTFSQYIHYSTFTLAHAFSYTFTYSLVVSHSHIASTSRSHSFSSKGFSVSHCYTQCLRIYTIQHQEYCYTHTRQYTRSMRADNI